MPTSAEQKGRDWREVGERDLAELEAQFLALEARLRQQRDAAAAWTKFLEDSIAAWWLYSGALIMTS